jgi:hypothetical protein
MLRLLIGGLLLFWEAQLIVAQSPEARPSATIPEKWMPNWMRRCLLGSDHAAYFLTRWTSADRKQAIVEELENEGILLDALAAEVGTVTNPDAAACPRRQHTGQNPHRS